MNSIGVIYHDRPALQLRETVALNFGELPMEFAIVGEVPPLRTSRRLLKGSPWRVALGE
jgi:hypothetical protein